MDLIRRVGLDLEKLAVHVGLCRKNLKSKRVKCCANCPFEEEIVEYYSELGTMFITKRKELESGKLGYRK